MLFRSTRDEAPTWKDDGYEIFLIAKDRSVNLHYLITAGGNIMDGKRTVDVNIADWGWNSGLTLKQNQTKKVWNTMVFIPWSDLGMTVDTLKPLMFQIFRRQTSGNQVGAKYQVLFPAAGYHNYSPEYFGDLMLMPGKNNVKNGSFEQLDPNGYPTSWNKNGKIVNDAADGKNAVFFYANKGNLCDIASNFFPVTAGTDYILNFSHKGNAAFAYVLFFDAKNKVVTEPGAPLKYAGLNKNWKFLTFQGSVPKNAVKAKVILRSFLKKQEDGAFVDNVSLHTGNMIK